MNVSYRNPEIHCVWSMAGCYFDTPSNDVEVFKCCIPSKGQRKRDKIWCGGAVAHRHQPRWPISDFRLPTSSSVNFKFRPRGPDDLRNGLSVLRPHHEQSGAIYHGDRSSDCIRVSPGQIAGGSFSFPVHPAQSGVVHNHYSSQDVRVRQVEKGQHNTKPRHCRSQNLVLDRLPANPN